MRIEIEIDDATRVPRIVNYSTAPARAEAVMVIDAPFGRDPFGTPYASAADRERGENLVAWGNAFAAKGAYGQRLYVFPDHDLGYRAAIAETATTCVLAETTLAARVDTLRELPARLPGLWHLLATGEVDIDTARLVQAPPRQCVFVDDLAHNVAAAARLGFLGIHHVSYPRTADEVSTLFGVDLR